jgi:hypothetical protein
MTCVFEKKRKELHAAEAKKKTLLSAGSHSILWAGLCAVVL